VRRIEPSAAATSGEWLSVKLRYKLPDSDTSTLFSLPVRAGDRVQHLPLAAAVAEFGLLLRDSRHARARWDALATRVASVPVPDALASDKDGFAELVAVARGLQR
jgi:Ca-activated chloride channel family protein